VLEVMNRLPREAFVPQPYRNLAYADIAIPLEAGQRMLHPKVEGRILQALALSEYDNVLEVGTGSGYLTACIAALARHVHSIDIRAPFIDLARDKLAGRRIDNVTLEAADLFNGTLRDALGRYDAIVVSGALDGVTDELRNALCFDGRLFVILGDAPVMEARLVTRVGPSEWSEESLFELLVPKLDNLPPKQDFVF
jgi:protein-L-isoaspartate(D-aspartate) O-methyltransferase